MSLRRSAPLPVGWHPEPWHRVTCMVHTGACHPLISLSSLPTAGPPLPTPTPTRCTALLCEETWPEGSSPFARSFFPSGLLAPRPLCALPRGLVTTSAPHVPCLGCPSPVTLFLGTRDPTRDRLHVSVPSRLSPSETPAPPARDFRVFSPERQHPEAHRHTVRTE